MNGTSPSYTLRVDVLLQGTLVMGHRFQRHADLNFIFKYKNVIELLTHIAAWYKTGHKIAGYNGELMT